MKRILLITSIYLLPAFAAQAQSYFHNTMFMYNKLVYNPGYAGSRDLTSFNALYRNQWTGIKGAPRSYAVSVDGPVGSYMKPFRPVALGLTATTEKFGVVDNTAIMGQYAYRIKAGGNSVLSLGLQAGISLYNAKYGDLNPYQQGDQRLTGDVQNAVLPNFGAGAYWYGRNFYAGFSVPNILENYYDKDQKNLTNSDRGKQIRTYFLSGGYVITLNDHIKLEPQVLARYSNNGNYKTPMNADFNLSCILEDRLLIGATYRTDQSINGIIHLQVTNNINIGYSYDYTVSGLNGYNNGTHEVMLGFDLVRDLNKYVNPRFVRPF